MTGFAWPADFGKLFLWLFTITLIFLNTGHGLHLQGTWKSGNFFQFLSKFGFQKTDLHDPNTLGYIYGNITLVKPHSHVTNTNATFATLLVVDRDYFLEYYSNRSIEEKNLACQKMFNKINAIAYDRRCYQDGTEDFIRKIPCPEGQICEDEDQPTQLVPNYQFTYFVHDTFQARFWYISMVACYRDRYCNWTSSHSMDYELEYDIWLVNGNPDKLNSNPFEFQFSFEGQDTVEIYLVFFVLYIVLASVQIYATLRYHHLLTCLFTLSLISQLLAFFCKLVHKFKFAVDGVGVESLDIIGTVIYLISQSLFMLLLLLLAKGWAITRPEVTWKIIVFCLWLIYTCINILLSIWNLTEVDVIEDIEEYQTIPGWISLIFRMIIMVWFLYELRSTMLDENEQTKLRFYLDFGAGILVWFFYLPMVALVALNISTLWRQKLLLGITSSADFLAYATIAHLLWPSRSKQYFQVLINDSESEELEEFSEAPHNIERSQKV